MQLHAAQSGKTLAQFVRLVTHVYLEYVREHGPLIERLAAEPLVANSGDPTRYDYKATVEYLAKILHENFQIPMQIALPVVGISYGIPAAAGHYITHHEADVQNIENITVIMILGSLEAVVGSYPMSLQTLRKPS